jgi:hypothetical protein
MHASCQRTANHEFHAPHVQVPGKNLATAIPVTP